MPVKTTSEKRKDPEDTALVLTYKDLNVLGQLCHKNLISFEDIVSAIDELSRISVEGRAINLEPKLLSRLKSRCLDKERFPEWLEQTIIRQLHDFAGW